VLTFDQYLTPQSLDEAFDALHNIPASRLLAGATDLLPWAREGRAGDVHLPAVIDISRVAELGGVSQEGARIRIGATTPISALQHHPLLQKQAPVLGSCALWFADDQIREQATVGGNLVNASPAGDTQPALLALNTHVTLARRESGRILERSVPLSEFILGPSRTLLQAGEIFLNMVFRLKRWAIAVPWLFLRSALPHWYGSITTNALTIYESQLVRLDLCPNVSLTLKTSSQGSNPHPQHYVMPHSE
jgi:CO/xanthine dehydrogenase FAD-binding subunit